jgi:hypothetical protein
MEKWFLNLVQVLSPSFLTWFNLAGESAGLPLC